MPFFMWVMQRGGAYVLYFLSRFFRPVTVWSLRIVLSTWVLPGLQQDLPRM